MTDFNSLPTVEQININAYWETVRRLEPEFYLIRLAIQETEINSLVIPKVIRALSNLAVGTGFGRVSIFMSNGKITQIKTEESDQFNESAIIDSSLPR